MNMKKINLQQFAAPEGMTGKTQINVKAREIDFVTSFAKNIQALLDVMSITRMIKKTNGTVLKTKKVTGTLKSGTVAEGDEIPLSQYSVTETTYDTITIDKYRKAVSLEAIAEKGYDAAIEMTDTEFKSDLQEIVSGKFYTQLKAGTLVSSEATWQMAIAMAIGKVKDKFKKMHRSTTGIAVWVNTLDLYEHLGTTPITVQTAFGMDYVKNFMGADIVFISSDLEKGNVIATPLNNIVAYYIDPSDSEFAKAGLEFTAGATTGMIGFHIAGNYSHALSEVYAIMGIRLFAEHLDGIAKIMVSAPASTAEVQGGVPVEEPLENPLTKVYTSEELDTMTVDQIKGIALYRGYKLTKSVKLDIVNEFLELQNLPA